MAAELTEDQLYNLSDEELEAHFLEAKASMESAEEDIADDEVTEDVVDDTTDEVVEDDIVVEEEEIVDESEQPAEDSNDAATDDEVEETITEEEETVTETDGEDQPYAKTDETTEDKVKDIEVSGDDVQSYKVKANGTEFEFTAEELVKLAPKAMDYTKKMQQIAPWRKSISKLEEAGLTETDLDTMIDVLKGDKLAMANVLKRTGVDALDLDTDSEVEYVPTSYGKSDTELNIQEVVSTISGDQEYAITQHVVDKQWDDKSKSVLVESPELIAELHADIKSGVYDSVSPMAMKMKVLDGGRKSDLDYYVEAGKQYYAGKATENAQMLKQQAAQAKVEADKQLEIDAKAQATAKVIADTKASKAKQQVVKKTANSRKAAATSKSSAGTKGIIDYLDDNDEEFDSWYKKLNASI